MFFVAFLLSQNELKAQDEKFKSIFIYNFAKLIAWPEAMDSQDFAISVYGSSPVVSELKALASKMKMGNRTIVVNQITSMSQFTNAHILFFSKEKTAEIAACIEELQQNHVLLITEKPTACSMGSSINFITKNGNMGFEVSPTNIDKAGLKVSTQLLRLGTVVGQ